LKHTNNEEEFLISPYAERQLITVVNDEQIIAYQKELKKEDTTKNNIAKKILQNMTSNFNLSAEVLLVEATIELFKALKKLKEQGIKTLAISQSVASVLKFPPGHPRFNVLYIAHPAEPKVYFPLSQFHRLTFEHKFSEAVTLLMSLGATYIEVEHITGWSKAFSSKMNISIPEAKVAVGGSNARTSSSGSEVLFTANYSGGSESSLPQSLVWYHHEPTWQQIAEGRMKYGLKDFSLNVRYDDDMGVNNNLKIAATKAGLDIAGNFEDHVSTIWKIIGKF
jgi:hypothetical protein